MDKQSYNPKHIRAALLRGHNALAQVSRIDIDRDTMLLAVRCDGLAYRYARERLKTDKEIPLTAVESHPNALKYATVLMRSDKEIVMTSVSRNGVLLDFASDKLKNDKEVAMAAVRDTGAALEYVSRAMKNDYDVALTAISQDGMLLRLAPRFQDIENKGAEVVIARALQKSQLDAAKLLPLKSFTDARVTKHILEIATKNTHKRVLRQNLWHKAKAERARPMQKSKRRCK